MDIEPVDTSELKKLKGLLEQENMDHEWIDEPAMGGASIKVPSLSAFRRQKGFSVNQMVGSYGGEDGLLEIWGRGMKKPKGRLTAEETLKILEKKTENGKENKP